jgi:hypothetical protein
MDRVTNSLGIPTKEEAEFRSGVLTGIRSADGFGGAIVRELQAGGSYQFLRLKEIDGQKSALFRLIGSSGVNYHEFPLAKVDGRVMATDIYVFLSGERLSETLRRSALPLAQEASKTWLEKLTTTESEYVKHYDRYSTMNDAIRAGRFADALGIYASLPPALRQDKSVLMSRYRAAASVGDQELVEVIEDFRRFHPEDVCLDFLLIDYYIAKKDVDQALASIGRLDDAVGGDPFLDSLRAEVIYSNGQAAEAIALAEKAISGAPELINVYLVMAGLAIKEKDHARTLATLKQIEEKFNFQFNDLSQVPDYADFVRSEQGREWLRTHPQR